MARAKLKTQPKRTNKTRKHANDRFAAGLSARRRLKEVLMVLFAAMAVFLMVSLLSYHLSDSGWSTQSSAEVQNLAGRLGAFLSDLLFSFFGYFAYLIPLVVLYGVWLAFRDRNQQEQHWGLLLIRLLGAVLMFASGSTLAHLMLPQLAHHLPQGSGGIVGTVISGWLLPYTNFIGGLLVTWALFLIGLTLYGGLAWLQGLAWLLMMAWQRSVALVQRMKANHSKSLQEWRQWRDEMSDKRSELQQMQQSAEQDMVDRMIAETEADQPPVKAPKKKLAAAKPESLVVEEPVAAAVTTPESLQAHFSGEVPSIDLLDQPKKSSKQLSQDALAEIAARVEEKLLDFGLDVKVVGACPGPVVTRFELQMAPGTKVSKLSGLAKDLARSLAVISVRIVEVIPGKPYVGLEIPNETREMVRLKDVLAADVFLRSESPLIVGMGKDIAGEAQVADLGKMPHLLVAGTTGSGKSVGLNAMLLSFLLKATPDELRLIMIDPKMLELSIYEGIPHLLTPVVTDMKDAGNALRWCVKEMDRRYRLMAALGVRNIAGMNDKVKAAQEAGEPLIDPLWAQLHPEEPADQAPELQTLPYIVVLVDEFADLMMVVGKKVEELIARLAQKARAAGIHLILATQRPSVDVITGLIKANIPTRMAFQVSSKIDSRTILDQQGAEQLLGHGDMLYLPPGSSVPVRIHGAFVADHEVHKVVAAWKTQGEPEYIEEVTYSEEDLSGGESTEDSDPLYDEAVKIVIDSQRASISGIQRRLKIGYNRAARLIEEMEERGIVSEMQQNGLREVLVGK